MQRVATWLWGAAAGAGLGLMYAASPLLTLTIAGSALLLAVAGRDLGAVERRRIVLILAAALAIRFLFIGALLVGNIPSLNDLSVGGLRGDDAYYLGRAIRARDILLGLTEGKYDFFVVSDQYGSTSYLRLLTILQVLFGPTPYSMRALNSLLFVTGGYLLFRLCRPGFGATATTLSLTALLFVPSLIVSSASLTKEPSFFLTTCVLLTAAFAAIRHPQAIVKLLAIAVVAICLWLVDDLRRGALVLAAAGLAAAVLIRQLFETERRAMAGLAIGLLAAVLLWTLPSTHARVIDSITAVAKTHGGHVFTSGHAYKLLDEGFYMHPGTPLSWGIELTDAQAARFVVRAAVSLLVTPLPWEMASLSELAFFPEHVAWWMLVLFLPIGVVAGWRRDRMTTALLIGFALPTAAAVALTNGNVGTLLRLRGLVTPYLIWIGVLGALSVAEWLLTRERMPAMIGAEVAR